MSLTLGARQDAGSSERQKIAPHFEFDFLTANLEQLGLQPLTREAVLAAERVAELSECAPGEPALSYQGRLLGGAPSDGELTRALGNPNESVYVVFGVGLGHTARALRALTDAPILVFEPDAGILRSVLELGPSDLSCFEIVCKSHDLTQIWPSVFTGRRIATVVYTPGYATVFADAARELGATLSELVLRSRINHATHRLRAKNWVEDVLANVEVLADHPAFLALAGKYRGVPAFIVGAGPSLGKNGAALADAKKKGLVFAVNSSARALARLGIEPQVLACMESIDVSALLRDLPFIDRVARAFTLSAHPSTLRTGNGPLLPLWEGIAQISNPLQELAGFAGVPVSGSVSTLAFALAQRLGCSPIVLVGQDLAYTGGRAYAPGTPYQDSRVHVSADGKTLHLDWCETLKRTHNQDGHAMHESEPLTTAKAWGGDGEVVTSATFTSVRAWLEGAAVVLGREMPELRLVNATEGGARVEGFEERALSELLAELPEQPISSLDLASAARAARAPLTREQIAQWVDAHADRVEQTQRAGRRIRRLSEASLEADRQGKAVSPRLARLDAAERELSRRVAEAPLLDAWSWGDVDRLLDERAAPNPDAQLAARDTLRFEARFGTCIDRAARELAGKLRDLSRRLRTAQ